MPRESQKIEVSLTLEEALELFYRCLNSSEADSPSTTSAMRKLGKAIEASEAVKTKKAA